MRRWALASALVLVALASAQAARTTLRAARPGNTALELRATSSAEHWTILVLEGGIESQRIEVQTDLPDTLPRLADADGDGASDLWVPVIGGNANTAWDVWLMQPARARFHRAAEVSGIAFSRDSAGRMIALGRNGCCSVVYTFHDVTPEGTLREAFAIERQADDTGGRGCEPLPIAIAPPPAVLRATCALPAGRMPGTPLRVP